MQTIRARVIVPKKAERVTLRFAQAVRPLGMAFAQKNAVFCAKKRLKELPRRFDNRGTGDSVETLLSNKRC
ncbi:MAG: hypothetical protein QGF56_05635 [Verrucomicrobiota bacterium]|jgi:hypothetical protein|nr:hypothetical protein [Verrucomicrobiota bacterium]